ncbi:MAG: hypothetical protein H7210_01590 [Pyrinomonadaceae bacterium]|nr:hypothetical protein [Phycisphaerales bacterium]
MNIRYFALSLGVIALASPAFGQPGTGGTITDANASFTLPDYLDDATGVGAENAEFHVGGPGNPNHLFQSGWWYRGVDQGITRELTLANGSSPSWTGNVGRTDYVLPDLGTARQLFVVQGLEDGYGALTQSLIFRNTTSAPITMDFFHYLDADLGGSFGGDSADLIGSNVIRIVDGDWVASYEGTDTFQVNQYADLLDQLTDGDADDLDGTGLNFGPGDFTAGFQWRVTIAPGRAVTLTSSLTITLIPAPGAAVLFGAGMLVMASRRNRVM